MPAERPAEGACVTAGGRMLPPLLTLCTRPVRGLAGARQLQEAARAFTAWESLPETAERHGLAPMLYDALRDAPWRVTDDGSGDIDQMHPALHGIGSGRVRIRNM